MMELRKRIHRLKNNNSNKLIHTMVIVMKEMGWSWEQMMTLPISAYGVIVDELNKEEKKQSKMAKKK